jgi:hypothetical protein
MRAQEYGGVADMSGIHRGVQARIRKRIPTAQDIHYKAHVLNLTIVHSETSVASSPIKEKYSVITRSYNFYRISPLIPIIFFCISGYMYFILELGTGLSQYIDYFLFLVIPSLCWNDIIEVMDYVSV